MKKEVLIYSTLSGKEPLTEWVNGLKDTSSRSRIRTRFARILSGNLGEYKYLSDGVSELKLDFGPGYRIYYSDLDNIILLLLCGGDKSSQARDIKKATTYLNDYKERTR
jgi:putative addiction module killer protein